jgi:hypothetical protein
MVTEMKNFLLASVMIGATLAPVHATTLDDLALSMLAITVCHKDLLTSPVFEVMMDELERYPQDVRYAAGRKYTAEIKKMGADKFCAITDPAISKLRQRME